MKWMYVLPLILLPACNSCSENKSSKNVKAPAVDITLHEYWAYKFLKRRGLDHACTHPQHSPCEKTENMGVHFYVPNMDVHSYSGVICCVSEKDCEARVNVRYFDRKDKMFTRFNDDPWCDSRHERFERFHKKPDVRLTKNANATSM